jgi:hypothetical protein
MSTGEVEYLLTMAIFAIPSQMPFGLIDDIDFGELPVPVQYLIGSQMPFGIIDDIDKDVLALVRKRSERSQTPFG